jgi:hypothetical protein
VIDDQHWISLIVNGQRWILDWRWKPFSNPLNRNLWPQPVVAEHQQPL